MPRLIPLLCLLLAGCRPMTAPMVERLDDDTQAVVDYGWNNMLSPPDRLDRTLLLDAVVLVQLYQLGVDRLTLFSEKDVMDGVVTMEIIFDRQKPEEDRFSIVYLAHDATELRAEDFSREEVEDSVRFFQGASICERDPDEPEEEFRERLAAMRAEIETRRQEIEAAMLPSGPE